MDKMDGLSMNIEAEARERLKSVFPECFTEGKLDIDKLLNLCGEYITDDFEKYNFTWKGKSESYQYMQRRSAACLRPCKDESVDFDNTQNLYIEGDNLEVLKLLQTAYFRQVKMIYIDPPYNTGNDFVYKDDFKSPLQNYIEITSQATKSNPETMGRFHTNWLNMMFPRLKLAANLLRDDGVIFISIDDGEVHNLRKLCDEVFGEENFIGNIIIKSNPRGSQSEAQLAGQHEYILSYAKSIENADIIGHELSDEMTNEYKYEDEKGKYRLLGLRQRGGFWRRSERPNLFYDIYVNPANGTISLSKNKDFSIAVKPIQPSTNEDGTWRWSKEKLEKDVNFIVANKVNRGGIEVWDIFQKDYINDDSGTKRTKVKSLWDDKEVNYQNGTTEIKNLLSSGAFSYSKPVYLIKQIIKMIGTTENDIILDFFSGSATTAHAVMQLNKEDGGNRRFIMIQLPELCVEKSEAYKAGYKNICEIGKERIRRAGAQLIKTDGQLTLNESYKPLDTGFKVFKLDSSNLKEWDGIPVGVGNWQLYLDKMRDVIDGIKDDRPPLDVVYELMLKLGIPLTCEIEKKVKAVKAIGTESAPVDKIFYSVDGGLLLFSFDRDITAEFIEAMADLAPAKIVVAEMGFIDNSALANAHYILQDRGIEIKLV